MESMLNDSPIMRNFPSICYCYLSMKSFCEGKIRESEELYDMALEAAETEVELYGISFCLHPDYDRHQTKQNKE